MTDARRPIERLIAKRRAEIAELETRLTTARAELNGLQSALTAISRVIPSGKTEEMTLKQGGTAERVYKLLKDWGEPHHIRDILFGLGMEVNVDTKRSVSSQLNTYVKQGRYFTRPRPGTYGLQEFGADSAPDEGGETE